MRKQNAAHYITYSFIHFTFICFCAVIIVPFLLVISISLSKENDIFTYGYQLIPKSIDLAGYRVALSTPDVLLRAYGVSIFITAIGTVLGLLITSMMGYCISRRDFRYKKVLTFYVFFTMIFNGGLVSYFIIITQYLHLNDNLLSIILPGLVNAYFVIIMKGFMSEIPTAIIESVKIDGAKEWTIFYKIILPLSKPALATVGLFIAFNYWNEWFNALLFINNDKYIPLQLLLVRMLNTVEAFTSNPEVMKHMLALGFDISDFPSLSVRMATAILVVGPMLLVFPFFQKYFVKGLTIGSVKG